MNVYEAKNIIVPGGYVKRILDMNDVVLWERKNMPSKSTPFYFRNTSDVPTKVCVKSETYNAPTITYTYSYDLVNWTQKSSTGTGFAPNWVTIPAYGTVYFKAGYDVWYEVYNSIIQLTYFIDHYNDYEGEPLVAGGNIMSLFYGDYFTGNETSFRSSSTNRECYRFFNGMKNIVDASELILPVTTMHIASYEDMFWNNTNLKYPPKELPATLESACYRYMFSSCSSLVCSPELPATTLKDYCYKGMFGGCSSLNKVICNARYGFDTVEPLDAWLNNVAQTGTFYKNALKNDWPSGVSGIPSGWTVVNI